MSHTTVKQIMHISSKPESFHYKLKEYNVKNQCKNIIQNFHIKYTLVFKFSYFLCNSLTKPRHNFRNYFINFIFYVYEITLQYNLSLFKIYCNRKKRNDIIYIHKQFCYKTQRQDHIMIIH